MRRLAEETGVDLGAVEGTGPDGAVLIADVEERVDAAESTSTAGRAFLLPVPVGSRANSASIPEPSREPERTAG